MREGVGRCGGDAALGPTQRRTDLLDRERARPHRWSSQGWKTANPICYMPALPVQEARCGSARGKALEAMVRLAKPDAPYPKF